MTVAGASISALEEIEKACVGDAIPQGVVTPLQPADLVKLAQAFDFDGYVGHRAEVREQKSEVRNANACLSNNIGESFFHAAKIECPGD